MWEIFLRFSGFNLLPDYEIGWLSDGYFPWPMIDDLSELSGRILHNPRLPIRNFANINELDKI